LRLYLDENLSPRIAQMLRARNLDVTSAHEAGNVGLDDAGQLRHATAEGRVIVTANIEDFLALDRAIIAANAAHACILLVSSAFRLNEFAALTAAIETVARLHPGGIPQGVLYLARGA
jgi:predicted nuclease of predicted toxin-antitoxin system